MLLDLKKLKKKLNQDFQLRIKNKTFIFIIIKTKLVKILFH